MFSINRNTKSHAHATKYNFAFTRTLIPWAYQNHLFLDDCILLIFSLKSSLEQRIIFAATVRDVKWEETVAFAVFVGQGVTVGTFLECVTIIIFILPIISINSIFSSVVVVPRGLLAGSRIIRLVSDATGAGAGDCDVSTGSELLLSATPGPALPVTADTPVVTWTKVYVLWLL